MKISVKKTAALLLAAGVVFTVGRCSKKTFNVTINKSNNSISNTLPTEDNTYAVNNNEESFISETINSTEIPTESLDYFVSDDIYQNLKNAKNSYENLLNNGEAVSIKMKNSGIALSDSDSVIIDDGINNIYSLICQYITEYESRNFDGCIKAFNSLSYYYYSGLSKDYLFKLLISNNLPVEYQSSIKYDEFGNMYDSSNNIRLENGKVIRLIGANDNLVLNNNQYYNQYENAYLMSKWIENLPSSLFGKYTVINNTSNDGVCYFWNETNVCDLCNKEYYQIISDGSNMYGYDNDNVQIICIDEDLKKYAFTDNNQNIYGELSYDQNMKIEKIVEIKNTVNTKKGNVLVLDSYISDMYNKYNNTYNK